MNYVATVKSLRLARSLHLSRNSFFQALELAQEHPMAVIIPESSVCRRKKHMPVIQGLSGGDGDLKLAGNLAENDI